MAEMVLINPRKRRKGRKSSSRRRRRARRAAVVSINPRRRRRRGIRRNPSRRRRMRSVRRNPLMPGSSEIMRNVTTAASAAVGAVALNVAWGMLPIPATLKTGTLQWVAKGVGAIALGRIARKVVSRSTADLFTLGALTVLATGLLSDVVKRNFPSLKLGYAGAGFTNMGAYLPAGGMGAYLGPMTGATFPLGGETCPPRPALPSSEGSGVSGFEDPLDYAQEEFASYDDTSFG